MAKIPARKTTPTEAGPKVAAEAADPAAAGAAAESTDEPAAAGAATESTDEPVNAAPEAAAKTAHAEAPADPTGKHLYRVLSPLDHDQVLHGIGAELELTEAQAAPLLGHTVALKNT